MEGVINCLPALGKEMFSNTADDFPKAVVFLLKI